VNKSRICDKDNRAKANYYKAVNEKKWKDLGRGKPYGRGGRKPDEGGASGGRSGGARDCPICGVSGHRFFECP
ncbi:hypothetical protein A2U01_0106087, partial [Trifolium medium]|nr:hypothetical protein [Trifolium medium]